MGTVKAGNGEELGRGVHGWERGSVRDGGGNEL